MHTRKDLQKMSTEELCNMADIANPVAYYILSENDNDDNLTENQFRNKLMTLITSHEA